MHPLIIIQYGVCREFLWTFYRTLSPPTIAREIQKVNAIAVSLILINDPSWIESESHCTISLIAVRTTKYHDERSVVNTHKSSNAMFEFVFRCQCPMNRFCRIFMFQCTDIKRIISETAHFEELEGAKFVNEIQDHQWNMTFTVFSTEPGNYRFVWWSIRIIGFDHLNLK